MKSQRPEMKCARLVSPLVLSGLAAEIVAVSRTADDGRAHDPYAGGNVGSSAECDRRFN